MAASIPATPLPAEAADAQGGVHPPYWTEEAHPTAEPEFRNAEEGYDEGGSESELGEHEEWSFERSEQGSFIEPHVLQARPTSILEGAGLTTRSGADEDVQPPPLEPESSFEETAAVIPQEPSPYSQSRAVDARRARRQARMAASIPATPLLAEATDAQGGVHPPTYWAEDQQA